MDKSSLPVVNVIILTMIFTALEKYLIIFGPALSLSILLMKSLAILIWVLDTILGSIHKLSTGSNHLNCKHLSLNLASS